MVNFDSPEGKRAMGIIREIGNQVSESGNPIESIHYTDESNEQLFDELVTRDIINIKSKVPYYGGVCYLSVNLTLNGWNLLNN